MSKDEVVAIIAAQPGWMVVEPVWEDGKVIELAKEPIIAWRVSSTEDMQIAYPITANGTPDANAPMQRPDGSLFSPLDRDFESDGDLMSYFNSEERAAAG